MLQKLPFSLLPFKLLSFYNSVGAILDYMEAVLREDIQTTEFYEFMEQTEIKCETDYNGSDLFKWIRILVCYSRV